jgi:cytochrome c553
MVMPKSSSVFAVPAVWIAALIGPNTCRADEEIKTLSPEAIQFFETKIRPVLVDQCYRCHSAEGQGVRGGLAVDSRDALLAGGESGPAIVPGNLSDSTLWNAINYEDYRMPPKNKLPESVIEDFRKWIEMGAPDPRVQTGVVVHSKVTQEDIQQGKKHWAFQKPVITPPSDSKHGAWASTNIDRYVAQGWDESDLAPAQDADPATLVRRLTYDLIGLPPTPAQRDKFVKDYSSSPETAIASLTDELMKLSLFGERWGRHWLDVARYAETTGKEREITFPHAWRYRDYVIDSFNEDKPYDQFIREQIAGDLIKTNDDREWSKNLIATGFLAIGPKSIAEQNPRQFQADLVDEQIDTSTRVVLGVSVACARCHDHKFDPIPQTDYYALAGIFQSTTTFFGGNRSRQNRQPSNLIVLPVQDKKDPTEPLSKAELASLKKQLQEAQEKYAQALRAQRTQKAGDKTPQNFLSVAVLDQVVAQLTNRINSVDENGKPVSMCMGTQDAAAPRSAKLLVRGEIAQPAQEVERGFVQVLDHAKLTIAPKKASGRLEYANWLTSKDNPLTARVAVNRIWQQLIGKAIVTEPDNFGFSGPAPTHPELLDYLAVQFMQNQWSTKQLIRSIVLSRVYRLSSAYDENRFQIDPDNSKLARANVRRLDAEAMRDSMLAISGKIDLSRPHASVIASFGQVQMGPNGPVQIPPAAMEFLSGQGDSRKNFQGMAAARARGGNVNPIEAPTNHRSVYLSIPRNSVPRALDVFDFAEPSLVVVTRETSNTPDQALYMLNNPFVLEQSDALASKILKVASTNQEQITQAFRFVFGRDATQEERKVAMDYFRNVKTTQTKSKRFASKGNDDQQVLQSLSQFCQALFCSAEFRFLN